MYSKKICLLPLMMLGGCSHTMPQPLNDNLNPDEVKETASGMDVPRSNSTLLKEVTIQAIMDCAKGPNLPNEAFREALKQKFNFLKDDRANTYIASIKDDQINALLNCVNDNKDQARLYAGYIAETIIDITIHEKQPSLIDR